MSAVRVNLFPAKGRDANERMVGLEVSTKPSAGRAG